MEAQLAALGAKVESGFSAMNRRMDDNEDVQRDRHDENVERLKEIEKDVKETNGRVTRHDEQIRTLFARLKTSIASSTSTYGKRELGIFLSGGASLIAAWRFVEWAFNHLGAR